MSLAEPELGLGIVTKFQDRTIELSFPHTKEFRFYALQSAPLKRIMFDENDEITSNDGLSFKVQKKILGQEGLVTYFGEKEQDVIPEYDLLDSLSFHNPEDKILNANSDSNGLFNLRLKTHEFNAWLGPLEVKGLLGARVSLIAHQFYLVSKISKRLTPRVLLADEVGLGKTIETGLIIHKLLITNRVQRVLVITPESLNFQWFIEMLRKYNLSFQVVNEDTEFEEKSNPFDQSNLVITSFNYLKSSSKFSESSWDVLVIDEIHKAPQDQFLQNLCDKTPSLILLSATPEINGSTGLFEQLRLIDPAKFDNFENFLSTQENLKNITTKARSMIEQQGIARDDAKIQELIDLHGPGRVLFRNTRQFIDKDHGLFPKRNLVKHHLKSKSYQTFSDDNSNIFNLKVQWLVEFLERNKSEKNLLICDSKNKVKEIETYILTNSIGNKPTVFHEDLSLIARDKKAASFADPEGANILICSEIGSEGRNFQFCQNLILFDLPLNPDLLEQRIGRLDRIGQQDNIYLHLPIVENSWEFFICKWYEEVLDSFHSSLKGRTKIFDKYQQQLQSVMLEKNPESAFKQFAVIGESAKNDFQKILTEDQNGRDILIELNSFNEATASKIIRKIQEIDKSSSLKTFLEEVYTHFGVDAEDLNEHTQLITPGDNMFIPHFPHLPASGLTYTFSREVALQREDLIFMSWDHPLVIGIMDLIVGEEIGSSTVMVRKNGKRGLFLELFFVSITLAPKELEIQRFLSAEPLRVLLDSKGQDFTSKWTKETLEAVLEPAPIEIKNLVTKIPKSVIKDLIQMANQIATERNIAKIKEAAQNATTFFDLEIERLKKLSIQNQLVQQTEIDKLIYRKNETLKFINESKVQIDAIKLIY
jgi:ATP-dependent helicase HepA